MTAIEWTDETWNPVTGCDKVSPGCDHCYAERMATRLAGRCGYPAESPFRVTLHSDRLDAPLHWAKPRRVFVNSMSDLFHPYVRSAFIAAVWDVMRATPHHTYQILTKRPQRMAQLLRTGIPGDPVPPSNVWLGTSIESDRYAFRADHLRTTPAAVRFLSLEPLLGPLPSLTLDGIDWVIVGGESGPGARPMHPAWARSIRDQCQAGGVPFFFKQWGHWCPESGDWVLANDGTLYRWRDLAWPNGPRRQEAIRAHHDHAELTAVHPAGKKAAGRLLDGRTWDEYPR